MKLTGTSVERVVEPHAADVGLGSVGTVAGFRRAARRGPRTCRNRRSRRVPAVRSVAARCRCTRGRQRSPSVAAQRSRAAKLVASGSKASTRSNRDSDGPAPERVAVVGPAVDEDLVRTQGQQIGREVLVGYGGGQVGEVAAEAPSQLAYELVGRGGIGPQRGRALHLVCRRQDTARTTGRKLREQVRCIQAPGQSSPRDHLAAAETLQLCGRVGKRVVRVEDRDHDQALAP